MSLVSAKLGLKPGDVFFVDGGGLFDNIIEWFQSIWGGNRTWARWSHVGYIVNQHGKILETTSWKTSYRSLADYYAGSRIKILRWPGMTEEMSWNSLAAMSEQVGSVYPYWRLLAHAIGLEAILHGRSMECAVLTASLLKNAGFPLSMSSWSYGPRELVDEMEDKGCTVVFNGRLRESGFIV